MVTPKGASIMQTITQLLHRILAGLSISIFVLLIVDVVLGVSSRYLFGGQIRWTEELATFLLVWLVFCGSAIAYHDRAHLGIDLLVNSFDPDVRRLATILGHILVFTFVALVMVWGGTSLTLERLDSGQMMSTLGIQKAWLYLSIPLNGTFILWFNLSMVIAILTGNDQATGEEVQA